jgi:hypothetical protein
LALNNGERTFETEVVAPDGIFEPLLTANLGTIAALDGAPVDSLSAVNYAALFI